MTMIDIFYDEVSKIKMKDKKFIFKNLSSNFIKL